MSRTPFFRTAMILAAAPTMALAAVPAAQAAAAFDTPSAVTWQGESAAKKDHHRDDRYSRYGRYDDRRYDDRRYDDRRYDSRRYGERLRGDSRVWRGNDGRYYCQRSNGTTGLLIGAAGGALIGRELTRDRTLGAIVGAAGGALLGRQIDRGNARCR